MVVALSSSHPLYPILGYVENITGPLINKPEVLQVRGELEGDLLRIVVLVPYAERGLILGTGGKNVESIQGLILSVLRKLEKQAATKRHVLDFLIPDTRPKTTL